MLDQLEVADLVLVNKADLVSQKQKDAVVGYAQGINPRSEVIVTLHSKVDLSILLKKRFDL
jgi:G3E family GTPase